MSRLPCIWSRMPAGSVQGVIGEQAPEARAPMKTPLGAKAATAASRSPRACAAKKPIAIAARSDCCALAKSGFVPKPDRATARAAPRRTEVTRVRTILGLGRFGTGWLLSFAFIAGAESDR